VVKTRKGARSYRYLLGDTQTEAARLQYQARIWDPDAHALFDRLGIRRGWRVLEIGPGQGSLHLDLRRRVQRPVDIVEPSAAFRSRLQRLVARDGLGEGQIWTETLAAADLPRGSYDLIFARWVFLFLPDPGAHIRQLAAALKPGGRLAIQDYYRDTFMMIPAPAEWPPFRQADHAFFATQGGDANIALRLPALYEAAGLDVTDIAPTIKTGRPGTPVWTWLSTYFLRVMNDLAALPPFSPAAAKRLVRHWKAMEQKKTSLLISPCVVDVVGRKRRQ
jgi:SAM-dependent methyltransferase